MDEFGEKIAIVANQTTCGTGAFEVTAGTTLIHSKLTMGHGKCQTDEVSPHHLADPLHGVGLAPSGLTTDAPRHRRSLTTSSTRSPRPSRRRPDRSGAPVLSVFGQATLFERP